MAELASLVPNFLRCVGINSGEISGTKEGFRIVGTIDKVLNFNINAKFVGDKIAYIIKHGDKVVLQANGAYNQIVPNLRDVIRPVILEIAKEVGPKKYNEKMKEINSKQKDNGGEFIVNVLSALFKSGIVNEVKEAYTVKFGNSKVIAVLDETKIIYDFDTDYSVINVKSGNGRLFQQTDFYSLAHVNRVFLNGKDVDNKEVIKAIEGAFKKLGVQTKVEGNTVHTPQATITYTTSGLKVTSKIQYGGSSTTPINLFDLRTVEKAIYGNNKNNY